MWNCTRRTIWHYLSIIADNNTVPDGDGDPDVERAAKEGESESVIAILLRVDIAVVEPRADGRGSEGLFAVGDHGSLWGTKRSS